MYKVIKIENKKIPMASNGGTLREYRNFFKRDMLADMIKLEKLFKNKSTESIEASEILENIAWTLSHRANNEIKPIEEWLEQFDNPFSLIKAYKDIKVLLDSSSTTIVKDKNGKKKFKKRKK